jgi:hypothetical protein
MKIDYFDRTRLLRFSAIYLAKKGKKKKKQQQKLAGL